MTALFFTAVMGALVIAGIIVAYAGLYLGNDE